MRRKSPDANENRANICVHEHEEIGENTGWKGRKRLITGCPKRACSPE